MDNLEFADLYALDQGQHPLHAYESPCDRGGVSDITKGEAAYVARCRADATLFDPTNGATPPIVSIAVN